jgi:EmrB/QacA subfamily drug resistance transporter
MSARIPIPSADRRPLALGLLAAVQFMTVLDVAVVNVALPSIQADLRLSQEGLQWVVSAYALTFGGFLLLGGRAADILGRRPVFVGGLVLFAAASLLAGAAWSGTALVGARTLQGVGAAALSPAALAILTTTFRERRERNVALGVWSAAGGIGGAVGMLLGGLFTDLLDWRWIFYVNVPVAVGVALAAPLLLRESRARAAQSFDAAGAVLVTAGLSLAVLAITKATETGWSSTETLLLIAGTGSAMVTFVGVERRSRSPLLPFSIVRSAAPANVLALIHGMAPFSMFLLLTLYMQQVLGFTALRTGAAFLAVASTSIVSSAVASRLITSIGVKPVLLTGRILLLAGLLSFTRLGVEGTYVRDLLPGLLIVGIGMPLSYVSTSVAALARVDEKHAGVASALSSTSQQIGAALGIAILSSVAAAQSRSAAGSGDALAPALVSGFHAAFWVGAAIALLGALASLVLIRDGRPAAPEPSLSRPSSARRLWFSAAGVRAPVLRAPGLRA